MVAIFLVPMRSFSQCRDATYCFTLDSVCNMAREHYPYSRQLLLNAERGRAALNNIGTAWLPKISVCGKTTYQSEVTHVSVPEKLSQDLSISPGKKYQYQGELSVTQIVYDGGAIRDNKLINTLESDIYEDDIKTSMLKVEENVEILFENILITRERIKMLRFQKSDLVAREGDLKLAVASGTVLKSVLLELQTSITDLERQETDVSASLENYYAGLSFYVQDKIDTSAVMQLPEFVPDAGGDFTGRPDYMKFDKRMSREELESKLIGTRVIPRIGFFANGYYGRPGLNAMDYSKHFSGMTGISLTWDIGSFYNSSYEKQTHSILRSEILNERRIFSIETERSLSELENDIKRNKKLMEKDGQMVKNRSEIRRTAALQLENGAITFADYYSKLMDESMSMADSNIHKISMIMDLARKKTILNK